MARATRVRSGAAHGNSGVAPAMAEVVAADLRRSASAGCSITTDSLSRTENAKLR